jgi:2-keto-4-pentenoate hydratase/2-oxohepta-3-ene-1,7-dioic acid hydratase in catechol pathway
MTLYVRFRRADAPDSQGILEGDSIYLIEGDLFGEYRRLEDGVPLSRVELLEPVRPTNILAAAVNYQSHVPSGRSVLKSEEAPSIPQLFIKPVSSIIGPERTILLPEGARRVDAEGELVAVMGRRCRGVSREEALDYVFGYTCGNDVSARHWQRDDVQWWRAKGSDTFSPIGPVIASGLSPADLKLRTLVNGTEAQSSSTSQLIHDVPALISFASQFMTLEPGDLIFTGTPGEPPRLSHGDVVEVEIEGIGTLRNPVIDAAA